MKNLLWAVAFSLASLLAGAAALALAEFGAPAWVFAILFLWLFTAGLPTFAAVTLLAGVWPGPGLGGFVAAAGLTAVALQWAATCAVRRGLARWRARSSP